MYISSSCLLSHHFFNLPHGMMDMMVCTISQSPYRWRLIVYINLKSIFLYSKNPWENHQHHELRNFGTARIRGPALFDDTFLFHHNFHFPGNGKVNVLRNTLTFSPLQIDGWKMNFPFGARPVFRGVCC